MHGAGVIALGYLMDAIAEPHRAATVPTSRAFRDDLGPPRAVCRRTEGSWDFGPGLKRKWNEIRNTPKHIRLLSNHPIVPYRELVWERAGTATFES